MTLTKGRIDRAGKIFFSDASLHVWEEGIPREWDAKTTWERQFKRGVFARVVQTLNRLGWGCVIPKEYVDQYGVRFAEDRRFCAKGDLKGWLEISGRCIKFEMWQSVNTPSRPDHGGKYEPNKEAVMPYVLRLEMERTRRRIRDYLCNVFIGYEFEAKNRSIYSKLLKQTAMEKIQQHYAESCHFKGDWHAYLAKNRGMDINRKSADGVLLEHGQRVWTTDWHGRVIAGIAYYNINNMWWVWTGKYDYTNQASFDIYAGRPENPRIKRNSSQRRKRLESELSEAIQAMNFERASVLRDILFPNNPDLFVVWHEDHEAYHRTGFCGYTTDKSKAGKFTADEVRGWNRAPNKVIPITHAKEAALNKEAEIA